MEREICTRDVCSTTVIQMFVNRCLLINIITTSLYIHGLHVHDMLHVCTYMYDPKFD